MENTTLQRQQAGALNGAQITMINQRTPQELVKYRKGRGGKMFSYVPHNYVTRLLNDAFCHAWSFEASPLLEFCNSTEVTVRGRLTIHTPQGAIVKEQFGNQEILPGGMTRGDALKGAGSDALRKCASLLGIALDLYGEEFPETTNAEQSDAHDQTPAQPQPKQQAQAKRQTNTRADLESAIKQLRETRETIDGKQSAYIYFTRELFSCGNDPEKLSKLDSDLYYFRKNGELKRAA